MIKSLCLATGLVFASATAAQACSVWIENRKSEFQYDHLSPTIYDREWTPFNDNALEGLAKGQVPFDQILQSSSVYLAKAKVRKSDMRVPHYGDLPIGLVEFKIFKTLKGEKKKSVWLSSDGDNITPVLDVERTPKKYKLKKRLEQMTSKMISSHDTFWFWDAQISPATEFGNPENLNSCGPTPLPQVSDNTDYIVFSGRRGVKYIPISGQNDILINTLKKAISNKVRVRLPMSTESYFRNVDYAFPVKLECKSSIKSANRGKDWWDPFTKFPLNDSGSRKVGATFKSLLGKKIVVEDEPLGEIAKPRAIDKLNADWPAIFAYYGDRDSGLLTCKGNESYLVYGFDKSGQSSSDVLGHIGKHHINLPSYRFAKIINGEILSASIKTNYALYGPNTVSQNDVMKWIEEGTTN